MLDEAERELIGKSNVLIDTTWPPALKELGSDTLANIVNKHGADKVCFGTDFPLSDMAKDAEFIESLPIPDAAKERMLGENFRELVGL
jgi:predicted TIM-barrel fold metal-dependent hydrolase